jgi:hypothetical protein
MSEEDVHPDEMSGNHEFDDEAIEALLSGTGGEINGDLAAVVDSMRAAYSSQPPVVGPELALLIGDGWAAAPSSRSPRRMRLPVALRRFAVATAALFALTGALGVANALPGPIQDAVSKVGIGSPSSSGGNHGQDVSEVAKDQSLQGCERGRAVSAAASGKTNDKPCPSGSTPTTVSGSTTTVPGEETTAVTDDNEGTNGNAGGVSGVAKDPSLAGCEHGRAVSGAASGKTNDKPCPSTTTTTTSVPSETTTEVTTTTAPGSSGGVRQDGTKPNETGTNNGNGRPTGKTNAGGNTSQNDD